MAEVQKIGNSEIQKAETKIANLEKLQELMKSTNAYYRKHKSLDGCLVLTDEQVEILKTSMAQSRSLSTTPFEPWRLTNNNAEIRRLKSRVEELARRAEGYVGWNFNGGQVECNQENDRIQIFFDEKPDESVRGELKSNGFRWAPSVGAWQRQLTDNVFFAADRMACIKPDSGERPTELQRKARAEKPSIHAQLEQGKSEIVKSGVSMAPSKGEKEIS